MSAEDAEHATEHPYSLPRPTGAYLGGMLWDWQPAHHPYIGGGYCSPRAGQPITSGTSNITLIYFTVLVHCSTLLFSITILYSTLLLHYYYCITQLND